jgi:hypothetical protein
MNRRSKWKRIIFYFTERWGSNLPEPFPVLELRNENILPEI